MRNISRNANRTIIELDAQPDLAAEGDTASMDDALAPDKDLWLDEEDDLDIIDGAFTEDEDEKPALLMHNGRQVPYVLVRLHQEWQRVTVH